MRRNTLALQIFLAILTAAFLSTAVVGLFAREQLVSAVDDTVRALPRVGSTVDDPTVTAAERHIIAHIDSNIWLIGFVSFVVAGAFATVLARRLSQPLEQLTEAVDAVSAGDLSHRPSIDGPYEIEKLGTSFNRMADSLEEGEILRRQLVADISHELLNPIASARAQAEAMIDGVLPLDEPRLWSLLDDLSHMSSLVDDLQELALAESGRIHYHMERIDLADIVRLQVRRASSRTKPNVEILARGTDVPAIVTGDALRITQVLRNLLSNAKRHTDEGSIVVSVDRDRDHMSVSVTDTGEGIPADALPHIFERLFRVDDSRCAQTGGAGLGLAISRRIIRDHGGEMSADSELGQGTTVRFVLPRAESPAE